MLFATLSRQVWFDLTWTVQQPGSKTGSREVLDHWLHHRISWVHHEVKSSGTSIELNTLYNVITIKEFWHSIVLILYIMYYVL